MPEKFFNSNFYTRKSPNLIKLGFNFYSNDHKQEFLKIQKMLITKYYIDGESSLTIMKEFNIPSTRTMNLLFKIFEIETRSLSDAISNSHLKGRSYNILSKNNKFSSKQFWHQCWQGDWHFLRSMLEYDYACQLDKEQISYTTESQRIRYFSQKEEKWRVAIPDFYLPKINTIVEIKGKNWFDYYDLLDRKNAFNDLGFYFYVILEKETVIF